MKTKYFITFIIISFAIIGSAVSAGNVFAQTNDAANIQYPVAELSNCQDEAACRIYCDKPENTSACLDFAEKNNLMPEEEIKMAKNFIAARSKGPGGCKGKDACETFCNDIAHIDECISYAEKNNIMPPQELEEAKKVQSAIKRGVKPPACGNKKQCDIYCNESDHMEECINFGVEAGFIQGKELEDSQKMLAALKRGVKPLACKGKDACDEYCNNPDHMEECMAFAMEAGFMSDKEKEDSQKMLQAIKKGVKPPVCKGKEECDVYCSEESHFEECMNFAEAAGFMTAEDAAMARKTGGKGPGGCKGKEECEAFCNNPDNQETCFNFAKDNGMIPEADLKQIEESGHKFQPGPGEINPGGQPMPQQAGPGGCKGPEECKIYCESNPDDCKNFVPEKSGQFAPGAEPSNSGGQPVPNMPINPGGLIAPEVLEGQPVKPPINNVAPRLPINSEQVPAPISVPTPAPVPKPAPEPVPAEDPYSITASHCSVFHQVPNINYCYLAPAEAVEYCKKCKAAGF